MFTITEQQTLDIDWFFTNDEDIAFVASGGGKLPESVAKSSANNKLLTSFFRSLPAKSDVIINPKLNQIITNPITERYLADFIFMAEKGLFSFDKTVLNGFLGSQYHLVAKPVNPLKINQLPPEIRKLLMEFKYNGNMELGIDSNTVR
jgi:hypothetical protein